MNKNKRFALIGLCFMYFLLLSAFLFKPKPVHIYLIGDSTVADYTQESDYMKKRFPITG